MAKARWLTVITVVKDDADAFQRTATSVGEQHAAGSWEWLVVDSSDDPTVIASIMTSHQAAPGSTTEACWTPPAGVYAAMNAGLDRASGEFVLFLNAGDTLFDPDVLSNVREVILRTNAPWLFGPVEIEQVDGARVITPSWDVPTERRASFARGHFPPHQGTFARRADLCAAGGFDTRYVIAADYAMFLRLAVMADPVQVAFPIAVFVEGGLSTQRWRESFREFHHARRAILAPRGTAACREWFETVRHYAAVSAYRTLRSLRGEARTA